MTPGQKRVKSSRGLRGVLAAYVCVVAVVAISLLGANVTSPGIVLQPSEEGEVPGVLDYSSALLQDAGLSADAGSSEGDEVESDSADTARLSPYLPDEVLVSLPQDCAVDEFNARLSDLDYVAEQSIGADDIALGWVKVKLADGQDVMQAADRLVADQAASAAQPNFVYRVSGEASADQLTAGATGALAGDEGQVKVADGDTDVDDYEFERNYYFSTELSDPMAKNQWALDITAADKAYSYARTNLHLDMSDSTRPSVAILDTGAFISHDDLKDNIIDYYDAVEGKGKDDSGFDFGDIDTSDWHGTQVAGVVSAFTNNSVGIAGMSGNAGIVPVNVFKKDGSTGQLYATSDKLVQGYKYVMNAASIDDIKAVNMSLEQVAEATDLTQDDKAVMAAIDEAAQLDILTVSAAGNYAAVIGPNDKIEGLDPYSTFPSYFAERGLGAIALWALVPLTQDGHTGASMSGLGRFPYSNYNVKEAGVDQLSAPGYGILSTSGPTVSSYAMSSGSSMAAPCIAGIAALVWWANPDLSSEELESVLYSTARDIDQTYEYDDWSHPAAGFDEDTGFGCIDAYAAVTNHERYLSGSPSIAVGVSTQLMPHTEFSDASSSLAWTWKSDNEPIATVSGGTVTGKSGGVAVITAESQYAGNRIVVKQLVTVHNASIGGAALVLNSGNAVYSIADSPVNNGVWSWSVSDSSLATVDASTGKLVAAAGKTGTVTVTATLSANPEVKLTKNVRIGAYKLTGIRLSAAAYTYNGKSQRPGVTVTSEAGTVPASGYTLSFSPADTTNVGVKTVTATGKGGYSGTVSATYRINAAPAPSVKQVPMYRMYNPNSGEHFYTASTAERDSLRRVGWNYEGLGWTAPNAGEAVYRMYNPNAGDHHYTTSAAERDSLKRVGWKYEGIGWYSYTAKRTPLYRLYNPNAQAGSHHYTTSAAERDSLARVGWRKEGVGWYGM